MIVESVKCRDLTREELLACRGYPLSGCDCSQCRSLRGYGIPNMPRAMLSGDPRTDKPTRDY